MPRLLLDLDRFVEGDLHPAVATGQRLRHQREVLQVVRVLDGLRHAGEAHHVAVERHPLVHQPGLHRCDAVVDGHERVARRATLRSGRPGTGHVARQVGPVVTRAIHQGVPGVPERRDGRQPDGAVLVADVVRFLQYGDALGTGVLDAAVDVGYFQRQVDHPVAVGGLVLGQGGARTGGAGQHEPGRTGAQDVGPVLRLAGLGPGVGLERHPKSEFVVEGGLAGVATGEHRRIQRRDGERVGRLVVVGQADELAQLVLIERALLLGPGEPYGASGAGPRCHRLSHDDLPHLD